MMLKAYYRIELVLSLILLLSMKTIAQNSIDHQIPTPFGSIYCKEFPGEGTPLIFFHGFPDNGRMYDSLALQLKGKRLLIVDFLGWGKSAKPKPKHYEYSAKSQEGEIGEVINYFKLDKVVLVAHDMAGPPVIDYTLHHESKVEQVILLNTYYHKTKNRHPPFTLVMFSTPVLRTFIVPVARIRQVYLPIFKLQLKSFFASKEIAKENIPLFADQFRSYASRSAFFRAAKQVNKTVKNNVGHLASLKQLTLPVLLLFGEDDKILPKELAFEFQKYFGNALVELIPDAKHYPHLDKPEATAEKMLNFLK